MYGVRRAHLDATVAEIAFLTGIMPAGFIGGTHSLTLPAFDTVVVSGQLEAAGKRRKCQQRSIGTEKAAHGPVHYHAHGQQANEDHSPVGGEIQVKEVRDSDVLQ